MRFRLPFALLSVTKACFTREIWREKMDGHAPLASLLQEHDRRQSNLISWYRIPSISRLNSLASRQLGASMDLDPGAARRLREALDILASGELPECPVCKPPRA